MGRLILEQETSSRRSDTTSAKILGHCGPYDEMCQCLIYYQLDKGMSYAPTMMDTVNLNRSPGTLGMLGSKDPTTTQKQ